MKKVTRFHISRSSFKGFTLIELLIVIGIIAILAAATFVALNPLQRFQDSRNARRRADISALLSAIKVNQVDNGGDYLTAIKNANASPAVYMIGTCDGISANQIANAAAITTACVTDPTLAACLDVGGLQTGGYLGTVPQSPPASITWGSGSALNMNGYTLEKSASGLITIRSCESEGSGGEITLSR